MKNEVIWIIGASSGIGHELALELAAQGARLMLSARRKDELEKLKIIIGEQHIVFPLDIADSEMTLRTAQAIRAATGRIDRAIFMSAGYTPMKLDALDIAVTRNMIEINLLGAFNVVNAVLPIFNEQKSGKIALCGSVAGYVGMPNGQPYSATKAAIISLAESLHAECPEYINVKLISPGFVRTALTDKNKFSMPFMIESQKAAKIIASGLQSKNFEIHFPRRLTLALKLLRIFPHSLMLPIIRKIK